METYQRIEESFFNENKMFNCNNRDKIRFSYCNTSQHQLVSPSTCCIQKLMPVAVEEYITIMAMYVKDFPIFFNF